MAENMEALPEEVLIQRAQAQDYDAMDALMQRYKGIVRKRARSLFISEVLEPQEKYSAQHLCVHLLAGVFGAGGGDRRQFYGGSFAGSGGA